MHEEKNEPYYLKHLNPRQKEAVENTEGALLILAGAGAGKTKTISHRILHLIRNGVRPSAILAITFTNKAGKEMRERVYKLLEEDKDINRPISLDEKPFISTFHSLGVHIIKEQSSHLGLPRHFSIFDKSDSKTAIKQAMESKGVDPKRFEPGKILGIISREKGNGTTLDEFAAKDLGYAEKIALDVWEEYENILKKEKALDFDDLLLKTRNLLRDQKIREYYQNIWKYIHIDEYQDTNRVQYEIAKLLAEKEKNIAVVGDIDQSIYSWRGADFKNMMRFQKDYPEAKTILLEQNYRSTKTILAVANDIIKKNTQRVEKNLFTENEDGDLISVYIGTDEKEEAKFIAKTAKNLIAQGVLPEEIAVLYRANFQSRNLEEAMLRYEVSYELLGTKFFERKEVKDVISYLKAALNPDSLSDLKRIINVPARGIGKVSMLKIFEGKENELPAGTRKKVEEFREILKKIKEKALSEKPSETIKYILSATGIEYSFDITKSEDAERVENIRELATTASMYDTLPTEEGIEKFLENASLSSDQDDLDKEGKKKGVRLMTIHASKGLEFDYVFITGLEEDLFPHKKLDENTLHRDQAEEERRLFYVALTRARKKLYLTHASIRTIFGSKQWNTPSEFLSDIDENFIQHEGYESGREKIVYLDF